MSYVKTLLSFACCALLIQLSYTLPGSDDCDLDKLYGNFYDPAKKLIDVECDACIVFVRFIQDLSRANKSEDEIIKAAVDLCSHLHIQLWTLTCAQGLYQSLK